MDIIDLLKNITPFYDRAIKIEETWSDCVLYGTFYTEFYAEFTVLATLLSKGISIRIDNENNNSDDFNEYKDLKTPFTSWQITINKKSLLNVNNPITYVNFYFEKANCVKYFNDLDVFDDNSEINKHDKTIIFIGDLKKEIIGFCLLILPFGSSKTFEFETDTIPKNLIKSNVHFIANDVSVDTSILLLKTYDLQDDLSLSIINKSCLQFATCLVNEFYSQDKVTLDGIRKVTLQLGNGHEKLSNEFYENLISLVKWVYEERVSTRKKLFNERLTLEYREDDSLLSLLIKKLDQSLEQAKERYNFVILERKDAYAKELKELLKDIKGMSDAYALKTRTLLSNFLRDTLAALVLVGFTIFTKFSDSANLNTSNLLEYVFNGLAIYFIASVLFQAIVDITDLKVSNKEIIYWKNVSKEQMSEEHFTKHMDDSLKTRKTSFNVIYFVVCLLYIGIAISCRYYPLIFKELIKEKSIEIINVPIHKSDTLNPKIDTLKNSKP